uniref:Uncharacterized protein n=1 Tax=Anguilla anguilla TaxID=7936 RepID=A0A0E9PTF8_ANGAN
MIRLSESRGTAEATTQSDAHNIMCMTSHRQEHKN